MSFVFFGWGVGLCEGWDPPPPPFFKNTLGVGVSTVLHIDGDEIVENY